MEMVLNNALGIPPGLPGDITPEGVVPPVIPSREHPLDPTPVVVDPPLPLPPPVLVRADSDSDKPKKDQLEQDKKGGNFFARCFLTLGLGIAMYTVRNFGMHIQDLRKKNLYLLTDSLTGGNTYTIPRNDQLVIEDPVCPSSTVLETTQTLPIGQHRA